MMKKYAIGMVVCLLVALTSWTAWAQEGAEEMPATMGPPAEMQGLDHLVGTWDVAMESKMDPADTGWIPSSGVMTYRYAAAGATLLGEFESKTGPMQFSGISLQCYDAAVGQWQVTWTDNGSARIALLTGEQQDGKLVVSGPDRWGELEFWSRVTTYNETDTTFDWSYEMSFDGGKTWELTGRAKYTKRK